MRYIFLILLLALSILFIVNVIVLRILRLLPFFKSPKKSRRTAHKDPNILYQNDKMTIYKGEAKNKKSESR